MHGSIAYVRRFLAANIVIITFLSVLLYMSIEKWDGVTKFFFLAANLGNASFLLWIITDAIAVSIYLRRIRPVTGPQSFVRLFFFTGATWRQLKSYDEVVGPQIQEILGRAKPFLDLKIREVLWKNGISAARDQVVAAEQEFITRATKAEEERRRNERKTRAVAEKIAEGESLGISGIRLHALFAKGGIDLVSVTITEKKRENALSERAYSHFCTGVIEQFIREGNLDGAEVILEKAVALLTRANMLGIEGSVKILLIQGDLPAANQAVDEADNERALRIMKDVLSRRIDALPQHKQPQARKLFERLDEHQFGTRPFRKALYELEQAIPPA